MSNYFTYPNNPIPWNGSPKDFSGDSADVPFMGLYAVETVQRYIPGTRHITWDGRVFKYALAADTVGPGRPAGFGASVATNGVAYTTITGSKVVGDVQVSIASQSFAKDILAGGLVLLYGDSYTYYQQRGIIGNNYCSSATLNIDLDGPLSVAITTASTGIEVMPNPYRYIHNGTTINPDAMSAAGIPAARAVSGEFFWMQTWGMCNVEPGETISGGDCRQLVKRSGTFACGLHTTANAITLQSQHYGFILDSGTSSTVPFVMLQISI